MVGNYWELLGCVLGEGSTLSNALMTLVGSVQKKKDGYQMMSKTSCLLDTTPARPIEVDSTFFLVSG